MRGDKITIYKKDCSNFNQATSLGDHDAVINDCIKFIDEQYIQVNRVELLGTYVINAMPLLLMKHQEVKILVAIDFLVDGEYFDKNGDHAFHGEQIEIIKKFAEENDAIPFFAGIEALTRGEDLKKPMNYKPYKFGALDVWVSNITFVLMASEPKETVVTYFQTN